MSIGGKISAVDWDEVVKNKAVREVTTMTLSNTAKRHDAQTDRQLLSNLDSRIDKLKHLLDLSMAEVNGRK